MKEIKTIEDMEKSVRAGMLFVTAVADAIRDLGEVPSGELYAHLMGKITVEDYKQVIQLLTDAKMIKVEHHLIKWIGPAREKAKTFEDGRIR